MSCVIFGGSTHAWCLGWRWPSLPDTSHDASPGEKRKGVRGMFHTSPPWCNYVPSHSGSAIWDNMNGPWEYHAKQKKSDRKSEEPHDFTHMWNRIKREATDEQTRETNKQEVIDLANVMVVTRGKGVKRKVVKGREDQICGHGRFGFGWWAHDAMYRWCILELYAWNLCALINPWHPDIFNLKKQTSTQ